MHRDVGEPGKRAGCGTATAPTLHLKREDTEQQEPPAQGRGSRTPALTQEFKGHGWESDFYNTGKKGN